MGTVKEGPLPQRRLLVHRRQVLSAPHPCGVQVSVGRGCDLSYLPLFKAVGPQVYVPCRGGSGGRVPGVSRVGACSRGLKGLNSRKVQTEGPAQRRVPKDDTDSPPGPSTLPPSLIGSSGPKRTVTRRVNDTLDSIQWSRETHTKGSVRNLSTGHAPTHQSFTTKGTEGR